jgi:hypothetical protein
MMAQHIPAATIAGAGMDTIGLFHLFRAKKEFIFVRDPQSSGLFLLAAPGYSPLQSRE